MDAKGTGAADDPGVEQVRRATCAHEYLLAFSCTGRSCCPRGQAKRLTLWTLWLEHTFMTEATERIHP